MSISKKVAQLGRVSWFQTVGSLAPMATWGLLAFYFLRNPLLSGVTGATAYWALNQLRPDLKIKLMLPRRHYVKYILGRRKANLELANEMIKKELSEMDEDTRKRFFEYARSQGLELSDLIETRADSTMPEVEGLGNDGIS